MDEAIFDYCFASLFNSFTVACHCAHASWHHECLFSTCARRRWMSCNEIDESSIPRPLSFLTSLHLPHFFFLHHVDSPLLSPSLVKIIGHSSSWGTNETLISIDSFANHRCFFRFFLRKIGVKPRRSHARFFSSSPHTLHTWYESTPTTCLNMTQHEFALFAFSHCLLFACCFLVGFIALRLPNNTRRSASRSPSPHRSPALDAAAEEIEAALGEDTTDTNTNTNTNTNVDRVQDQRPIVPPFMLKHSQLTLSQLTWLALVNATSVIYPRRPAMKERSSPRTSWNSLPALTWLEPSNKFLVDSSTPVK